MSDIKSMFHQIRVSPEYRDALRFLWWTDGNLNTKPQTYRMCVHLFGGIWSPSCATFALQRVAHENVGKFDPNVLYTILKNLYVDDCLKACDSEEEMISLVNKLINILDSR